RHHLPAFVLTNFPRDFIATDLFIERVQKLLPSRCPRKGGAMMLGSAKTTKVEQSFIRSRKRHSHAIEQVDDRRRHLAHGFRRRLIREKVAAINRVVEMLPD